MQFQVPQFVDTEDKIIGPLTLKQFLYLAVAAFVVFLLFFVLQTWLWMIVAGILGGGAGALAFVRYNGRPLIHLVFAALEFLWKPKFYVWHRQGNEGMDMPTLTRLKVPAAKQKTLKHLWLEMNTSTQAIEKRESKFSALDFFKRPKELVEQFEVHKKETGDQEVSRRVDYR